MSSVSTAKGTPAPVEEASIERTNSSDDEEGAGAVRESRIEELFDWYVSGPTAENSLSAALEKIITKTLLYPTNIIDYGPNTTPPRGRYALRPALRANVNSVVDKFQALLQDMAYEIPWRVQESRYYKIDAHKLLITALGAAQTLVELQASWDLLRERLKRGCRFVEKYLEEHRHADHSVTSPVSTTASTRHQLLEDPASARQVVQTYRTAIPSTKWNTEEELVKDGVFNVSWDTQVADATVNAFPVQPPEDRVVPYSYSAAGEVVAMPVAGSSSFGENQFQLPPMPFPPPRGRWAQGNRYEHRVTASEKGGSEAEVAEAIRIRPDSAPADYSMHSTGPVAPPNQHTGTAQMGMPPVTAGRGWDGPLIRGRETHLPSVHQPPSFRGMQPYDVLTGAASAYVSTIRRPFVQRPERVAARPPLSSLREEGAPLRTQAARTWEVRGDHPSADRPSRPLPPIPTGARTNPRSASRQGARSAPTPPSRGTTPPMPPGPPGPPSSSSSSGLGGGGGGRGYPRRGRGSPGRSPSPSDHGGGRGRRSPSPPGGGPPWGGGPPGSDDNGPTYANPYHRGWDYFHGRPTVIVSRMDNKLKIEEVPEWDGDKDTAVNWIATVQEFASYGDYIPWQLGQYLWLRLREGSKVRRWYHSLSAEWKMWMRQHYRNFLTTVIDYYLGDRWQQDRQNEYTMQRFRQAGHANESPLDFIQRRILYCRMLLSVTPGSVEEVREVMQKTPVAWRTILVMENIASVMELQVRVSDMEPQLLEAARSQSDGNFRTNVEAIVRELSRAGYDIRRRDTSGRTSQSISNARPYRGDRYAHAVEGDEDTTRADETKDVETDDVDPNFVDSPYYVSEPVDPIVQEAYATSAKRQRPPPKGGYPFAKRDDVVSPLRLPPSPCKCCGSSKHWDRECPMYSLWEKKFGKSARLGESSDFENVYNKSFEALVIQATYSSYLPSEMKSTLHLSSRQLENMGLSEPRRMALMTNKKPTVETIEDSLEGAKSTWPHATTFIVETEMGSSVDVEGREEGDQDPNAVPEPIDDDVAEVYLSAREEPPREIRWVNPKRKTIRGQSALGVSVVAVRGWVGEIKGEDVDLRLDSCADITLVSSEFYNQLRNKPRMHRGKRMNLWQLTDKGGELEGFVELPIFVKSDQGPVLGLKAEAYVVPGMTVPILLGEDFHLNYELQVNRSVEFGTTVKLGGTDWTMSARGVRRTGDFGRLRKSGAEVASFVRSKIHRRNKARRQAKKKAMDRAKKELVVREDVRIAPYSCKKVRVDGDLDPGETYYVERTVIGSDLEVQLIVPNTLVHAGDPYVPVSNPTGRPRVLRRGDSLAEVRKASEWLDQPRNVEEAERMVAAAEKAAVMIAAQVKLDETSKTRTPERDLGEEGDSEELGPKTAATPENETIASEDMEKVLDVGEVPEALKPQVWEMLKKHTAAFAFDGRLGHLDAKVKIRTKEGVDPISVPMYGSSPAKRKVIDEQLDKWFEQGVIEPSESPWGAPVVIVYRNGKARFCVDYRKLNAVTIPDEFPLPRQSEILATLSGAQVLSSLDALSGFTQLELDPADVEKTAFRTHRGLFQFKRMPFGLRNGPSIFQRVMQSVLAPYLWLFTLVYIDDIVVYSRSFEEHIEHLDKVLGAVERAGITLSPAKCHLFYSSILLLGHKVSRLGLSTHAEKVKAITELARPTKVQELQMFLGMLVYFSAFIPYYASIASPFFQLLRKGAKWEWKAEHEYAFEQAKKALQEAPVLGHPVEGKPYRLYTDASDEALGACLQQIQPISVGDLKGTKAYERLKEAFETKSPVPTLTTKVSAKLDDTGAKAEWAEALDSTTVNVERVIGYWSRTFRDAERRYSATEREALAAKEALIKFQPFIEGERVILVTDHAALQWAKTYENANRRLASWGAVYSAFAPGLEIVHRPGRVHSNVDPLSRLPRAPPPHTSPVVDDSTPLKLDDEAAREAEAEAERKAAPRAAWVVTSVLDAVEPVRLVTAHNPGATVAEERVGGDGVAPENVESQSTPKKDEDLDPFGEKELWKATHLPPSVSVHLSEELREQFLEGYRKDPSFHDRWEKTAVNPLEPWEPENRFLKDEGELLYFRDADWVARLCVPKALQPRILREAHESPHTSAHAGPEKLWEFLSQRFYWPRMKVDVLNYCRTCDVCQKTKPRNFKRYGKLTPHAIPRGPYDSVSMDLIVNLPWSEDEYNAILVVVDRLTKHAQFIPTTTGLKAEGFAALFVKHVVCRYGLPISIVSDRDPRWTSHFWKEVARTLKIDSLISSSHHPQHDGQTEIVNKQLEIMLRAYVADDKSSWATWLPMMEHAYNSRVHSSTGLSPYFLLYGFQPRTPLDLLARADHEAVPRGADSEAFVRAMEMHRESARIAIARAQLHQTESYNKGRRSEEFEEGDLVLVNPHNLEWVESKGEGAKLVQRWIGPFEVQQRIAENTYRLKLEDEYPGNPVFNLEHLRRYHSSPEELGERAHLSDTRVTKPADEVYEVEAIVGHQYNKKRRCMTYLVRWAGYSPLFDSWMTASELRKAPKILYSYRQQHKLL